MARSAVIDFILEFVILLLFIIFAGVLVMVFLFIAEQLNPLTDNVADNIAQTNAERKRKCENDPAEDYEEAHRNNRIADTDIFKTNTEGDDD